MPELEVMGEPDLIISARYTFSVPHFSKMINYYPAAHVEEIYHEKYVHVRRMAPVIPIDRQQDATMILNYPEGETMSMSAIKYQPSFPCCRKC
jgi:hypothetical protein